MNVLLIVTIGIVAIGRASRLFVSCIVTADVVRMELLAERLDETLFDRSGPSLGRIRFGDGWICDRADQKLLKRTLKLTMRRTQTFNLYPDVAIRARRIAEYLIDRRRAREGR